MNDLQIFLTLNYGFTKLHHRDVTFALTVRWREEEENFKETIVF